VSGTPVRPEAVERFNCASHLAGAVLALVALAALLYRGAADADTRKRVGLAVYGASLVALYVASSLYHAARGPAKRALRHLDHLGITLLIAGTYTPFALVTLRGERGMTLLVAVWAMALAGFVLEFVPRARALSVGLYVVMGWLAVTASGPLARALHGPGMAWLFAGGVLYTVGVPFYVVDRRVPFAHGVFHLFVLAGSATHFVAVWAYVA
jgi:hemolysin III